MIRAHVASAPPAMHDAPMPSADAFMTLVRAIVARDSAAVSRMIAADRSLVDQRAAADQFLDAIAHYIYGGDTALHVAAAAFEPAIARSLLAAGADVGARNRRGAQPLHYACDGVPGAPTWNPRAQAATITALINAGADPNALDKSGVAPLHRAVRTRCASAVKALLAHGADATLPNSARSTPIDLALRTTGRGGSGSPEARAQQEVIVRLLREHSSSQAQ